ncbi:tumor necrosis factor receptor superfamily member 14-like isoform X2 [Petaurus breviceps papuanus]
MFSMIMMTQPMPFTEALDCRIGEYEVDGRCCPSCHAGYRVRDTCNTITNTFCLACKTGTYTPHPNGLKECLQCKDCDPGSGFVTRRECLTISNTVCGCFPAHICVIMKGDDCELCEPHRVCPPGQYVKSQGTERSNTICEKCQAGTFSPNGTLGQCLPWTNCTAQGLLEEKPGTDTTDALCLPGRNPQLRLIRISFIVVSVFITVITFILCALYIRKKKPLKSDLENASNLHPAVHLLCISAADKEGSETTQKGELLPLKEKMFKIQDNQEP